MDSGNSNPSGASSPPIFEGYVAGPPDRPATWEDIVNLPDVFHAEIVNGRVHHRLGSRGGHGHTVGMLSVVLHPARGGQSRRGGWWIIADGSFFIGHGSWVAPDVAGLRRDRCPKMPSEFPMPWIPDWVCEVLSPSNAHYDRGDKGLAYAKAGVPWLWIVDTRERTLEVLELVGGRWQIHGCYTDGAALALPPFDDVVVNVSDIFVPKDDEAAL